MLIKLGLPLQARARKQLHFTKQNHPAIIAQDKRMKYCSYKLRIGKNWISRKLGWRMKKVKLVWFRTAL